MPLAFKPVQSTIASKDGIKKWHPKLLSIGKPVTTQEVAEMIAERSSLSPGDTHNVMRNIPSVFKELLLNGRPIHIEGLGTFHMVCRTNGGVDTPEEVNPNQIKRLRIQFTPSSTRTVGQGTNRAMYTGVQFVRIDTLIDKSSGRKKK